MKIYDSEFREITDYRPDDGWLQEKERVIRHDAVEGKPEQGHWETVKEYPETGGADVAWVVDVPGVQAQEAREETERYLLFTPWTAEELAQIEADRRKPSEAERIRELEEALEMLLARDTGGASA